MTAAEPGRLTERARDALNHAEREARTLNHDAIGQKHLLLGLLDVEDGLACAVLSALNAEPAAIRASVLAIVPRQVVPSPRTLAYTPRLQRALELAVGEAEVLATARPAPTTFSSARSARAPAWVRTSSWG